MGKIFEALKKAGYEHSDLLDRLDGKVREGKNTDPDLSTMTKVEKPAAIIITESRKINSLILETYISIVQKFRNLVKTFNSDEESDLITITQPNSFTADQFKILRTNILFPIKGPIVRSILVTSTHPGEGKSFVSANLSVSIAQNINENVLLIDCDLRKPRIHSIFGLNNREGLSDYLANGNNISSVLCTTALKKLKVITGGNIPTNPSELLSSEKMSNLLTEVKERYLDRYIIIDSPPPQLTSETMAISRQVDGILLVVKSGSTKREMLQKVIEHLGRDKIIGVVLNNYNIGLSGYYYSYKEKYFSKIESVV